MLFKFSKFNLGDNSNVNINFNNVDIVNMYMLFYIFIVKFWGIFIKGFWVKIFKILFNNMNNVIFINIIFIVLNLNLECNNIIIKNGIKFLIKFNNGK